MGLSLGISDIQKSYQSGRPSNNKPRQILACFASYRTRAAVYDVKSRLKTTDIFVSEDLTKWRNQLFYQARQLKKKKRIEDTYTRDGHIIVKFKDPAGGVRQAVVLSESDLSDLNHR